MLFRIGLSIVVLHTLWTTCDTCLAILCHLEHPIPQLCDIQEAYQNYGIYWWAFDRFSPSSQDCCRYQHSMAISAIFAPVRQYLWHVLLQRRCDWPRQTCIRHASSHAGCCRCCQGSLGGRIDPVILDSNSVCSCSQSLAEKSRAVKLIGDTDALWSLPTWFYSWSSSLFIDLLLVEITQLTIDLI